MTSSSNSQQEEKQIQIVEAKDFALNVGTLETITLVNSNGESVLETLPKECWNNEIKTRQYLEQRMTGVIQRGDEIAYDKVKFTRLEDLDYGDETLGEAIKLLIAARDSTDRPEAVEAIYSEAKNLILKISPPTKGSLDLLYVFAIFCGRFYENDMKNPEKAAEIFTTCGSMIIGTYMEMGLYLFCEAPYILLDKGKYQISHDYFAIALETTLKFKKYEKCLDLIDKEMVQFSKEESFHKAKKDSDALEKCYAEQWIKVCCATVVQIQVKGVVVADKYFKTQLNVLNSSKNYGIAGQNIAERILNAYKEKNPKLLEKVKRSNDLRRNLPTYVYQAVCNLKMVKNEDTGGILNKKHSNKEL